MLRRRYKTAEIRHAALRLEVRNQRPVPILVAASRPTSTFLQLRPHVVFVFDLAPAHWNRPQCSPFSPWREYVVAEGCHERSKGSFRRNARRRVRAFVHLMRTVRGHCASLEFLIGGAGTTTVFMRGTTLEARSKAT
jgi:hypothetical protein